MKIQIGTIQEMNGTTATVVPNDRPDIVTQPLVVPFYWRETMGNLQPGEEVYFFENHEHGGYIIGRTDGEWDNTLRGTFTVTEDITAQANITASGDVTAGTISLQTHTHTGDSGGNTSPPK